MTKAELLDFLAPFTDEAPIAIEHGGKRIDFTLSYTVTGGGWGLVIARPLYDSPILDPRP